MPFIDSRITLKITDRQKEEIKTELGKLITTLNKSETYLMVGIEDACDLWLAGKKLEDAGAPASGVVVLPAPLGDEAEEDAVEV